MNNLGGNTIEEPAISSAAREDGDAELRKNVSEKLSTLERIDTERVRELERQVSSGEIGVDELKKLLVLAERAEQIESRRGKILDQINDNRLEPSLREELEQLDIFGDNAEQVLDAKQQEIEAVQELEGKIKTTYLKERNQMLRAEIEGIPLWGGEKKSYRGKNYPAESVAERRLWINLTAPFRAGRATAKDTEEKITQRIEELKKEQNQKTRQVKRFLAVQKFQSKLKSLAKANLADIGDIQKIGALLDIEQFVLSNQEDREMILLQIASEIKNINISDLLTGKSYKPKEFADLFTLFNWRTRQEADFNRKMKAVENRGVKKRPAEAWEFFQEQGRKLEKIAKRGDRAFFGYWLESFQADQEAAEQKMVQNISAVNEQVLAMPVASQDLNVGDLKQNLKWLKSKQKAFDRIPNEVKTNLENHILYAELLLHEKIENHQVVINKEAISENKEPIENIDDAYRAIWNAQEQTGKIRGYFLLIAALAMSASNKITTSDRSKEQIVQGDEDFTKERFEESKQAHFEEKAKQSGKFAGTQAEVEAGDVSGLDYAHADDEGQIDYHWNQQSQILEAKVAEAEKYTTSAWELTETTGFHFGYAAEDVGTEVLKNKLSQGQGLHLTEKGRVVSTEKAKSIIKQKINPDIMPGKTAKEKALCVQAFYGHIDTASGYEAGTVRSILEAV
jgi:hypothetical protein